MLFVLTLLCFSTTHVLALARKCEFVSSDGSHYDISPLYVPARPSWKDSTHGTDQSSDPNAGSGKVDTSIVSLPYWSAYFQNAGTLAINPCGGIQNVHDDCPVDENNHPTNLFVQLRVPENGDIESEAHKSNHCIGFGTFESMKFLNGDDLNAGFKISISGGTEGRSAVINFVCGRSTGEITSFVASGEGAGSAATVTFVTKYACPKVSDADAEKERQRKKEAERKARQKMAQSYSSLKQARLQPPPAAGGSAAMAPRRAAASASAGNERDTKRSGFARLREAQVGFDDVRLGSRSIDELIDEQRRKKQEKEQKARDKQRLAQLSDAQEQHWRQQREAKRDTARAPSPTPSRRAGSTPLPVAVDRRVRVADNQAGGVAPGRDSLDVYQQLLAKMREKANKDGSAGDTQKPIDSHPLQPGKDRLLQLKPLAPKADNNVQQNNAQQIDNIASQQQQHQQQQQQYEMQQEYRQEQRRQQQPRQYQRNDYQQPRRNVRDDNRLFDGSVVQSNPLAQFGNQILLMLLLAVAAGLGVVWFRSVKAQRQLPSRIYEYEKTDDFEKRSTQFSYEKFVSDLASKQREPVGGVGKAFSNNNNDDDDDEDDEFDSFGSLLPPAPASTHDDTESFFGGGSAASTLRGPSADNLMRRQRNSPTSDLKGD